MNRESIKLCVVCGDRANGYNFNVIACESCKAFFRRNALRKKDFKCAFDNRCKIDVITRKFCQKCRLTKCFDTGMKKDLILTDEEKRLIKYKIAENKQKRIKITENSNDPDSTNIASAHQYFIQKLGNSSEHILSDCSHLISPNIDFNINRKYVNQFVNTSEPFRHSAIHQLIEATNSNSNSRLSIPSMPTKRKFSPIEAKKSNMTSEEIHYFHQKFFLNNLEDIVRNETGYESNSYIFKSNSNYESNGCQRTTESPYCPTNQLNEREGKRLNELSIAFTEVKEPSFGTTDECFDAIKMTDRSVRRLIQMIKNINAYKTLCQIDQIALMKAGCTELLMLRSVITYNYEKEFWTIMTNSKNSMSKFDLLKQSPYQSIYHVHKNFMRLIVQEWESDMDLLNLLSAIVLFNPKRDNITHKDIVAFEHQTYKYLLHRYLEIKYQSQLLAKQKFTRLMATLEELRILYEEQVRWHLEVDPREIGPLLIELFNLKP